MDLRPFSERSSLPTVELQTEGKSPETLTMHDADTLYSEKGLGNRIVGINAAEVDKITPVGGFSAGSQLGNVQTQVSNDLMNEYGFNRKIVKGKDAFGRQLIDIQNKQGESWSTFATKHGIVLPSSSTSADDMIKLSFQRMQDQATPTTEMTPLIQAKQLVDSVLSEGTTIWKPQANTIEQFQDYLGQTSNKGLGAQEEAIRALEERIKSPKISSQQREEYQTQLVNLRESYQRNLNAPKDIFTNSIEGVTTGGHYGAINEFSRALSHGWVGVKDTAASFTQWLGDVSNNRSLEKYGQEWEADNKRTKRLIDVRAGDVDPTGGTLTTLDDVSNDITKVGQIGRAHV